MVTKAIDGYSAKYGDICKIPTQICIIIILNTKEITYIVEYFSKPENWGLCPNTIYEFNKNPSTTPKTLVIPVAIR